MHMMGSVCVCVCGVGWGGGGIYRLPTVLSGKSNVNNYLNSHAGSLQITKEVACLSVCPSVCLSVWSTPTGGNPSCRFW